MKSKPIARASRSKRCVKLIVAAITVAALTVLSILPLPARAQADGEKNPIEATEQNLALGLDHFDGHCAKCHGRMGKADTEVGKSLKAADLTSKDVQSRSDKELFTIISNGVNGTGMPAFGKTHSPDEIWHMVLFVRKLPTLTDAELEKLESEMPANARHHHGAHGDQHQDNEMQMPSAVNNQKQQQPMQGIKHGEASENSAGSNRPGPDRHDTHSMSAMAVPDQEKTQESDPVLTLADLQNMALKNNPTLIQAQAQVLSVEGRRKQAGLYPNPLVGYSGQEFAFRGFSDKSEHFFFVEQSIVTGGKLKKSQKIFEKETAEAQAEADAQRMRVLNTVNLLYYEVLGAQQEVELRQQLAELMHRAVVTSEQLVNVGQADRPDLIETENEASESDLNLIKAENERDQIWRMMAALVGLPELKAARLEGSLDQNVGALDENSILTLLLQNSPEIKRAKAGVERARAVLARTRAELIPDLFVRGQIGYSYEPLETLAGTVNRRTGTEASVEVGVRLPLFNRNQGNIGAAEAELTAAENEVKRQELALRARLVGAFKLYKDAVRASREYKQNIIPRAEKAHQLYQAKYREMAAAYPQVIISERALLQARINYTGALVALQENSARIQGFLLTGGLDAPHGVGGPSQGEAASAIPVRLPQNADRSGSEGQQ